MTKHLHYTPGPWWFEYHKPGTDIDDGAYLCHEGGSLFEGGLVLENEAENAANARLIAAAPELYDALAAIVEPDGVASLYTHHTVIYAARRVLRQARGEE